MSKGSGQKSLKKEEKSSKNRTKDNGGGEGGGGKRGKVHQQRSPGKLRTREQGEQEKKTNEFDWVRKLGV